tara:strand:+ start:33729 stop:34097 length:369 start_codon:yes stop_codon:yes gene_type:complete
MKMTIAAVALTLVAGTASAADFTVAGQTLTVGGDLDANYTTGVEAFAIDLTNSVGFNAWGVDFSAEHSLDVLRINEAGYDLFQGLALESGYTIAPGVRTYGKVAMDNDFDFGDVTVGASFSF